MSHSPSSHGLHARTDREASGAQRTQIGDTVRARLASSSGRILLVKRDKIGDLLLATPVLAQLRAALPSARIDVLANDYNAWVVTDHPAIDRLWVYRRSRHAGRLRAGAVAGQVAQWFALAASRYDVAIVLNGEESPRGIQRALAVHARETVAYVKPESRLPGRLSVPLLSPTSGHELERMLALCASPLGLATTTRPDYPHYTPPGESRDAARAWLRGQGLEPRGYVVIGLGSRYPETQPSPPQISRWARLIKRHWHCETLLQYTPGGNEGVAYPGSEELAATTLALDRAHVRLMPTTLPLVIALLYDARTSILPDGGLMHFAAASPGGVLGLFAGDSTGSYAGRWGPRGPRADVVESPSRIAGLSDDVFLTKLAAVLSPSSGEKTAQ